jgi:hypothetical protein
MQDEFTKASIAWIGYDGRKKSHNKNYKIITSNFFN